MQTILEMAYTLRCRQIKYQNKYNNPTFSSGMFVFLSPISVAPLYEIQLMEISLLIRINIYLYLLQRILLVYYSITASLALFGS